MQFGNHTISRKSLVVLFVITITIVLAVFSLTYQENSSDRNLQEYFSSEGVYTEGLDNYSMTASEENTVSGVKVKEVSGENANNKIEAEILSGGGNVFAENYLKDRENEIISMYTDTPSPYAAVPEREINCAEGLKPNITFGQKSNSNYTYYELHADQKLSLGVCSEEKATYKVKMVNFYCPDTDKIVEVSVFYTDDTENSVNLDSFRCMKS